MELTPELLLEAKFGPARRGYDMAEVDDFLERCAEGLDVLLERLKAEFERAEAAEAMLAAGGGRPDAADATVIEPMEQTRAPEREPVVAPAPTVDEPMRILVHAERTAEAAVADARAEAERIRAEAESVANRQRSEAEQMLATAKAEAEEEARKAGEETKRSIQAEVLDLRRDRDDLTEDIRSLRRWLDGQRTRMRASARELQRLADDPTALKEIDVPDLTDAKLASEAASGAAESGFPGSDTAVETDEPSDLLGEPTQAVPVFDNGSADVGEPWADRAR